MRRRLLSAVLWLTLAVSVTCSWAVAQLGAVTRTAPDTFIAFHGDSITDGVGTSDYGYGNANQKAYPYLVTSSIVGHTFGFVRDGINGQGLNYVYSQPPSSYFGTLTQDAVARIDTTLLQPNSAKYLVIFAGTNDIFLNGASGAATATLLQTYIAARISAGWIANHICVVTMLPRQGAHESDRTALNTSTRSNAAGVGYLVADVAADPTIGPAGSENNTTYYNSDNIHPKDAGQAIIGNIVTSSCVVPWGL